MKTFAENVRELIEKKKLSQKGLSKISGVSEPSLCRYLKEDGPNPRRFFLWIQIILTKQHWNICWII